MKKILLILLATIMVASVFVGCSSKPTEEPSAAATSISTPDEPDEQPPAEAEPEVSGIPEAFSPTTGLTDTTTKYAPVIVQIDNEPPARPQTGIQYADIVYETLIEGVDTRLTCIFNDAIYSPDAAEKITVGPVRSSRYYHQWIASEWDGLYVHNGGPDKTNNKESDIWGESANYIKQRINGAGKGAVNTNMFYKNKNGDPISHFAMTDIVADAALMNFTPTEKQHLTYYPLASYDDSKEIESIALSFLNKPGMVSYKYNADSDKLIRYMNGKEFKDDATGEAINVQNLIVQYTSVSDMPSDPPRKKIDMFGNGPAEFIIHGKHVKGTWERKSVSDTTKYYLENGDEVIFTPGNTWIEVHPNTKPVVITYADGTEYQSN